MKLATQKSLRAVLSTACHTLSLLPLSTSSFPPSAQYPPSMLPKASGRIRCLAPSAGHLNHSDVKFLHWRNHHNHAVGDHQHADNRQAEAAGLAARPPGRVPLSSSCCPGPAGTSPPSSAAPERRYVNSWTQRLLEHLE